MPRVSCTAQTRSDAATAGGEVHTTERSHARRVRLSSHTRTGRGPNGDCGGLEDAWKGGGTKGLSFKAALAWRRPGEGRGQRTEEAEQWEDGDEKKAKK